MAAPKPIPKDHPQDADVMTAILKDMGVTDYEPRLVNQMLEFTYRYVTDVLEDAQAYCNHAGRKDLELDDVKLAIQTRLDHSFTTPPPREFLLEMGKQKNSSPLPPIKPHNGPRIPPDRYCLSACNYRLKPSQKRPTLTMPPRLSTGLSTTVGGKLTPTITLKSGGMRTPHTISVSTKTPGTPTINIMGGSGTKIRPTLQRVPSSGAFQPTSVMSPSSSITPMSTSSTSTPLITTVVTGVKRKREDET
ncbi:transcription initiation factor TFIID subunit 9-like [Amphiura filiformis]|uniref:transcription initiation factor TFIID subunit 9-like n=1 Tax=Amphiura filiformis TaxID=82378 RepID=UPI003B22735C